MPQNHHPHRDDGLESVANEMTGDCPFWGWVDWGRGAMSAGPLAPPEEAWAMARAPKRPSAQSADNGLAVADKAIGAFLSQTMRHEGDPWVGAACHTETAGPIVSLFKHTSTPRPPVLHSVGLRFLYRALNGHPFFPLRAASGRCVLSAAAARTRCGVVSALAEPSSWGAGGCAGCFGGRFTVVAAHSPPHSGRPPPASPRCHVREAQFLHHIAPPPNRRLWQWGWGWEVGWGEVGPKRPMPTAVPPPPHPRQGAQPMPSHCPPNGKCQPQWHL